MKYKINKVLMLCIIIFSLGSCAKKLDLFPTNDLTPENTYSTADGYKHVLAKIYGGLASTGNTGPAGSSDIQGLDEGSQSPFIRGFFNCEELPTDEAVVAWNDQTIKDFHNLKFTTTDPFLLGIYARLIYNITISNEYLREASDAKVSARGITGADAAEIKKSTAEVRFLRAFNYWVMIDLFGKSTFITENDLIGTDLPKEIKRSALFTYVESELKAIDADLSAAKTVEYGRVDQAAAWALLARLYLNANVYIGTSHYADAINYANKVIASGYLLQPDYRALFMADNDKQKDEFIFAVNCDGLRTQSYGNTTFLVHAPAGDDHNDFGVGSGWNGYRATSSFGNLFTDRSGSSDQRAMFVTSKYTASASQMNITDLSDFSNGLHVNKFRNIRNDTLHISDSKGDFADIDFPIFRLSEMYLIYAEAYLRGGGGDAVTALSYINKIRARAYGSSANGQVTSASLNLQFILDERGRELYWEGHRRTDLIRYNLLTTNTYLWPWKGGSSNGNSVDAFYNLFPIPASNRTSNPNLTQNPGY